MLKTFNMSIQIRELVIRATISEGETSGGNVTAPTENSGTKKGKNEEKIVRRCVDAVLEILRVQNEN
tara:strand:- start:37894 stop:38094 length:201 start_codon:yes stop_codon:yes gene_type:complete